MGTMAAFLLWEEPKFMRYYPKTGFLDGSEDYKGKRHIEDY